MPALPPAHQLGRRSLSAKAPIDQSFLLQRVQPALSGLMDGSLSTLAPIFAVVLATHSPKTAVRGAITGGGTFVGAITGGGTFVGGVFHTLPFLIPDYHTAIGAAVAVVAVELLLLAWLRTVFFRTSFVNSFVSVTVGGAIIAGMSSALGVAAG